MLSLTGGFIEFHTGAGGHRLRGPISRFELSADGDRINVRPTGTTRPGWTFKTAGSEVVRRFRSVWTGAGGATR
jgi:hypothetical protein